MANAHPHNGSPTQLLEFLPRLRQLDDKTVQTRHETRPASYQLLPFSAQSPLFTAV
jgi:hypothetical protein